MDSQSNNTASQMDVRIPNNFVSGKDYIPLAQLNAINGQNLPAIGNYIKPPDSGIYVLGSMNGQIQWIATDSCN